ncbi:MAG: hypothetical protein ABIF89_01595 [bacterium]
MTKVTTRGLIQISLLTVVLALAGGFVYFTNQYYGISSLIKNADKLAAAENYQEAIMQLDYVKGVWIADKFGFQEKVGLMIKNNLRLLGDKTKYEKGVEVFNSGEWEQAIVVLGAISSESLYFPKAALKTKEAEIKILERALVTEKNSREAAEEKTSEAEEAKTKEETARMLAEANVEKKETEKQLAQEIANEEKKAREAQEAEEVRMNLDKDSDGLTLREELIRGTSDLSRDSDGDGIEDKQDSHPAGGGRDIAQHFEWNYGGLIYSWDLPIHSDWYDFYKNLGRADQGRIYVTYDDAYIATIANELRKEAEFRGYCKACFTMAFLGGLPYVQDAVIGYDDYPKYPIETLVEKNGDCEDTSYLAAAVIKAMGEDVVLVEFSDHMAIAVSGNLDWTGKYYELNGKHYFYQETTGADWQIGEISTAYENAPASLIEI